MKQFLLSAFLVCSSCLLIAGCKKQAADSLPVSTVAYVKRTGTVNHIWLMDLNKEGTGFNSRRLTSETAAENYPTWSPDGKWILYQKDYNGSGIYIVDADGKNERRLSPTPGFDVTPSWSPDGTKIIYTRLLGLIVPNQVPKTEIRIMNADGTGDHVILPASDFCVEPRWSVNDRVVFMGHLNDVTGPFHIFTMNIDGTDIRQLTQAANAGDPVWSPDGTQISFGSDREGNDKLNIFIMNSDGTNVRQLTHFDVPVECGDTNWSPDGKKIIFELDINGKKQSDPDAYAEVWFMNADGTGQTNTKQVCSCVGGSPRWKPR